VVAWPVDIRKGQPCVRYLPPMQRLASGLGGDVWLSGRVFRSGICLGVLLEDIRNGLSDAYVTQGCLVIRLKLQKALSWQGWLERCISAGV